MFMCLLSSMGNRHAVGKQGPITLDLRSSAFDPKEKVWTRFPPEGSKYTPPHSSCDFKWKDYCPQVFRLVITPISIFGVIPSSWFIYAHSASSRAIFRKLNRRTLRKLFKVDAADYMLSLCGDQALRELSSPGKSGSFFYLTSNDQYMIKTMKKAEVNGCAFILSLSKCFLNFKCNQRFIQNVWSTLLSCRYF